MSAAADRGRSDLPEINPSLGVVQIHANEVHPLAERLRNPKHIGQMPWFRHTARNRRITHLDGQLVPVAIQERTLVPYEAPDINLDQLYVPAKDIKANVTGRFGAAIVDKLLNNDLWDYILVRPFPAQPVVIRREPGAALFHQRLLVEPTLVADHIHPTRSMGRFYHEAVG